VVRTLTWGELSIRRPDLAGAGRRLLYEFDVGLGFLATVRPDGGPRVHPICPLLTEDGLYGLILPGPKLGDLRRDPRFALHSETCPPPRQDDGFYLTGVVREQDDAELRRRLDAQFLAERQLSDPWPGFDQQVLVEFLIERCLLTLTEGRDGLPSGHTVWTAAAAPAS
jgi:hypothetical protein